MNIKDLIKRTLDGEELSSEERSVLSSFDPESAATELENLKTEYAELQTLHAELQRSCRIEKIAAETGCTDPGYFDYLARKHDIDLEDNEAVLKFAADTARTSPGCFQARITPGPAAVRPAAVSGADELSGADRIGRIMNSLNSANAENL